MLCLDKVCDDELICLISEIKL